jgi:hypothetical protein
MPRGLGTTPCFGSGPSVGVLGQEPCGGNEEQTIRRSQTRNRSGPSQCSHGTGAVAVHTCAPVLLLMPRFEVPGPDDPPGTTSSSPTRSHWPR